MCASMVTLSSCRLFVWVRNIKGIQITTYYVSHYMAIITNYRLHTILCNQFQIWQSICPVVAVSTWEVCLLVDLLSLIDILTLTFICLNGLVPIYLEYILLLHKPTWCCRLSEQMLLQVPKMHESLSYPLDHFKCHLKTYLFQWSFGYHLSISCHEHYYFGYKGCINAYFLLVYYE